MFLASMPSISSSYSSFITSSLEHKVWYWLYFLQQTTEGKWMLICCGSTVAQCYWGSKTPITLEFLWMLWALRKLDYYVRRAMHFTAHTDHQPLVSLWLLVQALENKGSVVRLYPWFSVVPGKEDDCCRCPGKVLTRRRLYRLFVYFSECLKCPRKECITS